jgi:tRNA-2-methylthio-N6-dimethylallyladenosine synthase
VQNQVSYRHNVRDIGKVFEVLIEGDSRKSHLDWKGRNTQNKMVVFPKSGGHVPGEYIRVKITGATSATLIGEIEKQSS